MLVALGIVVWWLVPARGAADVAPYGWRPPPPEEDAHVVAFRASLVSWMVLDERLHRVHPRCRGPQERTRGSLARSGRGAGYGGEPACPSADRVREVAIDRAVRFFAAEILDASGRAEEAAALRDAAPMRDAAARAAVLPRLAGERLDAARELVEHGMEWPLERVAETLGRLVQTAAAAGVAPARMRDAAIEMLAELATPLVRTSVWLEQAPGGDPAVRLAVRRAGACLQREADARWRPVAVRVVLERGTAGVAVSSSGPAAVRSCVETTLRRELARVPRAPRIAVRIVAGPRGVLWGAPLDLE